MDNSNDKNKEIEENLVPFSDESNDYYCRKYIKEASVFYENKMLQLADYVLGQKIDAKRDEQAKRDLLKTSIPGVELPEHMAYKMEPLFSEGNERMYEFLIEYHTKKPSEGIYYGCRGVTLDGYNHGEQIKQFRKDWDIVRPELCAILNNTYPNKDFTLRFRLTDNANDQTYWLFWIQLYEDEDIVEVGYHATETIRNVFKRYIDNQGADFRKEKERATDKGTCLSPSDKRAFTNETYQQLLSSIKAKGFTSKETPAKTKECQDMFEKFIRGAINQRILEYDHNYERAYKYLGSENKVDFAFLIYMFFVYMCDKGILIKDNNKENISVPWTSLIKVFLDSQGDAFQETIKTQAHNTKEYKKADELEEKEKDFISTIKRCLSI